MKLRKIFQEWYDFNEEEYALMERELRKLDGKKRLIKIKRTGIFEKILLSKWKVDVNDEVFKAFEESVRKGLDYYLFQDDKMLIYIEKNGIMVASQLLYYWTQNNLKKVVKETLQMVKEAGR